MREIVPTPRTRVGRLPKRGSYDRATIEAILRKVDGTLEVVGDAVTLGFVNREGAWVRLRLVRKERAWVGGTQRRGGGNPIDNRLLKVAE